jgi:flagellum-specific peptidoglycan hydrolase FlgJ
MQWYKDYKGYKGVNRAKNREECARLLKQEGYATDPVYAQKLIKLMKDHD